jgi:hypothetical protein
MLLFQLELRWHKNALRSALSRRNDKRLKRSPAHYLFGDKTAPLHFHIFHLASGRVLVSRMENFPSSTTLARCRRRRRHFFLTRSTPPRDPFQPEEMRKTSASFLAAITCCCSQEQNPHPDTGPVSINYFGAFHIPLPQFPSTPSYKKKTQKRDAHAVLASAGDKTRSR